MQGDSSCCDACWWPPPKTCSLWGSPGSPAPELYRCFCPKLEVFGHRFSQLSVSFNRTSGEVHLHHQNLRDVEHCMPPDSELAAQQFPQRFHENHEIPPFPKNLTSKSKTCRKNRAASGPGLKAGETSASWDGTAHVMIFETLAQMTQPSGRRESICV